MKVVGSPDIVTLIDSRRVRLSVCLKVCHSVCLSVRPSVCPHVQNASSPVVLVGGALEMP